MAAVGAVLERAGADPGDVEVFAHGMTVGTNALLEERGARTALVATARLRRPARDRPPGPARSSTGSARRSRRRWSRPELRFEARRAGRAARAWSTSSDDGELEPGSPSEMRESGAEAVAVCLLFSYLEPEHEARIAAALRERAARRPRLRLARGAAAASASTSAARRRSSTPTSPPCSARYLGPAAARRRERGAAGAAGHAVLRRRRARRPRPARAGAWSVLSGPAGGAVGAGAARARLRRRRRARLRHGRHLLRRLRGRGRAACAAPTRARSAAG